MNREMEMKEKQRWEQRGEILKPKEKRRREKII